MKKESDEPDALSRLKLVKHSKMPAHIPTSVQRSLLMAAGANAAGAALWLAFGEPFSFILSPIGIIGLLMVAGVLIVSRGYTRPVKTKVHRLAWLASIPAAVNTVGIGVVAAVLIFLAVVVVVGGILCGLILLWVIGAAFR